MSDYDSTQFSPPAPVALVTLRNPENETERPNVVMLLDTGADVTLLPQSIVEELGISFSSARAIKLDTAKSSAQA